MGQLWTIFNTMQLLLILPYFLVKFPGNVLALYEIIVGVINFKIVESKTLYDWIVAPIFGVMSRETSTQETSHNHETPAENLEEEIPADEDD